MKTHRLPRGARQLLKLVVSKMPETNPAAYRLGVKNISEDKHLSPDVRSVAAGINERLRIKGGNNA